ncbi:LLM class flavin-dependent oxidoreductase [Parasphingopyxis marina]|uniref:LLM class flavin-dependent oxidoreductase n=1 Tax=Parasphingopyxis marina TaxID=2761622 RepID=A0A842HXK0_9SPHN|nr:LLM class flavin-dependent oxidoreductase [Parasphingopyxis marina]MBC2778878.1 LLM class flavin-dependent oxidoreductase [Parasphingopyxis marina]
MQFGLFYEHQSPAPFSAEGDHETFQNALSELELADRLGYDYAWLVEHHFLEEYSHSSAPEVFLGALSQRTKRMRLGHGICVMPPKINHPVRVAERIATLDLLSGGRVDWGTGESGTAMELEGFGVDYDTKKDAWREATEQCANMLTMSPYPGHDGEFFSMPTRNIVPKPLQKPHPPLWVACSRRDTILHAARNGMGALVFGFAAPEQAGKWVEEYYDIIKSDECVPIGHAVNPNVAIVTALSVNEDEQVAIDRGTEGFKFFGYSLGFYAAFGKTTPGHSTVWEDFKKAEGSIDDNHGNGGIGTPDQVYEHCKAYADVGVDQIIFVQQTGPANHDHICESLKLFAETAMPKLKADEEERLAKKQAELAPYVEAALARKAAVALKEPAKEEIAEVRSFGLRKKDAGTFVNTRSDRGGGLAVVADDPMAPVANNPTEKAE